MGRDNAFAGSEVKSSIIVDRARGRFWEHADVTMSPVVLVRVSASAGDAKSGTRKERREAANAEDDVNVSSSAVVDSDWLRSNITKSMPSLHLRGDSPRRCCRLLCGPFLLLRLDKNDPRVWQASLLASELADLICLAGMREGAAMSDVMASKTLRQAFWQVTGVAGEGEGEGEGEQGDGEIAGVHCTWFCVCGAVPCCRKQLRARLGHLFFSASASASASGRAEFSFPHMNSAR